MSRQARNRRRGQREEPSNSAIGPFSLGTASSVAAIAASGLLLFNHFVSVLSPSESTNNDGRSEHDQIDTVPRLLEQQIAMIRQGQQPQQHRHGGSVTDYSTIPDDNTNSTDYDDDDEEEAIDQGQEDDELQLLIEPAKHCTIPYLKKLESVCKGELAESLESQAFEKTTALNNLRQVICKLLALQRQLQDSVRASKMDQVMKLSKDIQEYEKKLKEAQKSVASSFGRGNSWFSGIVPTSSVGSRSSATRSTRSSPRGDSSRNKKRPAQLCLPTSPPARKSPRQASAARAVVSPARSSSTAQQTNTYPMTNRRTVPTKKKNAKGRVLCATEGCQKVSDGRRSNGMCRKCSNRGKSTNAGSGLEEPERIGIPKTLEDSSVAAVPEDSQLTEFSFEEAILSGEKDSKSVLSSKGGSTEEETLVMEYRQLKNYRTDRCFKCKLRGTEENPLFTCTMIRFDCSRSFHFDCYNKVYEDDNQNRYVIPSVDRLDRSTFKCVTCDYFAWMRPDQKRAYLDEEHEINDDDFTDNDSSTEVDEETEQEDEEE